MTMFNHYATATAFATLVIMHLDGLWPQPPQCGWRPRKIDSEPCASSCGSPSARACRTIPG